MPRETDVTKGLTAPQAVAAFLVTVLLPAAAAGWYASGDLAARLASLSGVAAIAVLFTQFVTSGRFEAISGRIGLDVTMALHRAAGSAVLGFVLLHLVALSLRNDPSPAAALFRIWRMVIAPGNLTGVVAVILLSALVVWARFLRDRAGRYELWRVVHGVGATAVLLLLAVHLLRRGDAVLHPLPAAILLTLGVVAVASLAAIYLVRPLLAYRRGFTVLAVRRMAPSVVELSLRGPKRGAFAFRAGQFAWLTFGGRHTLTDNPFSIASAPEDLPDMRFLVREAGDATRSFIDLEPGTPVAVDAPHGSFVARPARAFLLVAGGIGIAPILSQMRSAAARSDPRPYRLLYAAKTPDDLVAADELRRLADMLDLRVELLAETGAGAGITPGRVDDAALRRAADGLELEDTLAFVCGPPGMMDAAIGCLLGCGLDRDRIVMERFDYDAGRDALSRGVLRRVHLVFGAVAAAVLAAALWPVS